MLMRLERHLLHSLQEFAKARIAREVRAHHLRIDEYPHQLF